MKIFVDFDDVIFNTKKFGKDLKKTFTDGGIAEDVFNHDYLDYPIKGLNGIRKYNVWHHLQLLENNGYRIENIKKAMRKLMKKMPSYVFKDIADFSKIFGKSNLYVLSYGDKKFQMEKILKSKVGTHFHQIIVLDKGKSAGIKRIKKTVGEKIFFLDDRVVQIKEVKKKLPYITTLLVKRNAGRYNDKKSKCCDFEVKNLREAAKIIINR